MTKIRHFMPACIWLTHVRRRGCTCQTHMVYEAAPRQLVQRALVAYCRQTGMLCGGKIDAEMNDSVEPVQTLALLAVVALDSHNLTPKFAACPIHETMSPVCGGIDFKSGLPSKVCRSWSIKAHKRVIGTSLAPPSNHGWLHFVCMQQSYDKNRRPSTMHNMIQCHEARVLGRPTSRRARADYARNCARWTLVAAWIQPG